MAAGGSALGRALGPYDALIAFAAVVVSAAVAGNFTGAYWREAGLLLGPIYWAAYLAALAVAFVARFRSLARGMLVALPIALPAFFGLAVLGAFYAAFS
jgi:hypothetical protein